MCQEYLTQCKTYFFIKRMNLDWLILFLSKMTFAHLSQATAASQRFYHRTQNTFNRIQNSLMTIEIHDQGTYENILHI